MKITISHKTTYRYDQPVPYALQQLRLKPQSYPGQEVLDWTIEIIGGAKEVEYQDHHMNEVELVSFEPGTDEVAILCSGTVEVADMAGVVGPHRGCAPLWLYLQTTPQTKAGPVCRKIVSATDGNVGSLEWLHNLSAEILKTITYEKGKSEVDWTAEDAAAAGHGVCQDHAHVFIACCRHAGVPARYVSGYLVLSDLIDQNASHAWAEAHVEGLGWVGFDVSNEICPDDRYVRVATGLDYSDAAPISGTRYGVASENLAVQVQVQQ